MNHFQWLLEIRQRDTGEDLYPLLREKEKDFDPGFMPLTRKLFHAFEYWVKHTNAPPTDESEWARAVWAAPPGYDWGYEHIYLPVVLRGH